VIRFSLFPGAGAKPLLDAQLKTYKHLFEQVCSFQNLYIAYRKARQAR